MKWRRRTGWGKSWLRIRKAHKKGVSGYPTCPRVRAGQSQTRLNDRGYSKAQASLGVQSTDRWKPTATPGIHPKATQGKKPPQVRYDIDIRSIVDSQAPFVAGRLKLFSFSLSLTLRPLITLSPTISLRWKRWNRL